MSVVEEPAGTGTARGGAGGGFNILDNPFVLLGLPLTAALSDKFSLLEIINDPRRQPWIDIEEATDLGLSATSPSPGEPSPGEPSPGVPIGSRNEMGAC